MFRYRLKGTKGTTLQCTNLVQIASPSGSTVTKENELNN